MALSDMKGIVIASPFKLHATQLLDVRQRVDTIAERDALVTSKAAAEGLRVFVASEKKSYIYNGTGWDEVPTGAAYKHPTGDGNMHVPATGTTNDKKVLMAGKTAGSAAWTALTKELITNFPEAMKNPASLTFTGGSTETYDGSGSVSVAIPTALKCPKGLTIQLNGTSQGLWDGSVAKTVNVTAEAIGALPTTGGILSGAIEMSGTGPTKGYFLRDKNGNVYPGVYDNGTNLWIGALQGNSTHHTGATYISSGYNGEKGIDTVYIAVPTVGNTGSKNYGILHTGNYEKYTNRKAIVGQSSESTDNPWYKFASITITESNADEMISFKVRNTMDSASLDCLGILTAHIRTNATKTYMRGKLIWEIAGSAINPDDFVFAYKNTDNTSCEVELWCNIPTAWDGYAFNVIQEGSRTSSNTAWTLYNTFSTGSESEITPGFTQIKSTVLDIKNTAVAVQDYANANGKIEISWKEDSSTTARYFAVFDGTSDNTLAKIKTMSIENIQDMVGLPSTAVGSTTKPVYWDGTQLVACENAGYDHPTTPGNKHIPAGGASGQILRWSADGTAVWGDDNNTTYSVFKGSTGAIAGSTGLVPAPHANDQNKFLQANGTWAVPSMPTSLPSPCKLYIRFNGSYNPAYYDGSVPVTVDITPSSIGAAEINHVHSYAGSNTDGGAAISATKVPLPVGTILITTSSSEAFFASCFGGTWEVMGNLKAMAGIIATTMYMHRKTAL